MEALLVFMRFMSVLVVPLAVAMCPFLMLTGLSRLRLVDQSAPLLALATIGSVLSGFLSSGLAFTICAAALSHDMQGNGPKCVTGAVAFLLIGGFFMVLTLVAGLCLTVDRINRKAANQ